MQPPSSRREIAQALIVTAEVMGQQLTPAAAEAMATDLAREDGSAIVAALARCRREMSGRLTLAAILERLPGQHPSPNEAWALCPKSESATVVWTDEMAEAYGVAGTLLADGDKIGGRMAFLEAYRTRVAESNTAGRKPSWSASLGHDVSQRESVLLDAVKLGRLPAPYVARMLPGSVEAKRLASGDESESLSGVLKRIGRGQP